MGRIQRFGRCAITEKEKLEALRRLNDELLKKYQKENPSLFGPDIDFDFDFWGEPDGFSSEQSRTYTPTQDGTGIRYFDEEEGRKGAIDLVKSEDGTWVMPGPKEIVKK